MKNLLYLLIGLAVAGGLGWFLLHSRSAQPGQPASSVQPLSPAIADTQRPAPEPVTSESTQPPQETPSLSGHVLSTETGEGVPGAAVLIEWGVGDDRRKLKSITDSEGAFTGIVDDAPEYRLTVTHATLVSEEFGYATGAEGNIPRSGIEIWMHAGAAISGRVYDVVTNAGIGDVAVGLDRKRSDAVTDADGRYRIAGIRDGTAQMFLGHAKGYIDPRENENGTMIAVSAGQNLTDVDFALQPGVFAAITGKVVDEQGQPVADAKVTAVAREGLMSSGKRRSEKSKSDGTFVIDELKIAGGFYVDAIIDGHASDQLGPMDVTAQGIHDLVVTLYSTGSISGRVVDEHSGKPVSDPMLTAETIYRSYGMNSIGGHSSPLDKEGNFNIADLPAGSYGLHVATLEFRSGITRPQVSVDLKQGEHRTGIELTYDYDGYLQSKKQMAASISALRNEDKSQEPHVGLVHGQVVRADTGAPITTFYLQANHTSMGMNHQWRTVHDPDGRFTIEEEKAETLSIKITSKGYAPGEETVQGGRGPQPAKEITVRLQPGAVVEGIVTDTGGKPVAGADIYAGVNPTVMGNAQWDIQSDAISQPDGSFRLDSLADTITRIYAKHPDFTIGWADVKATRAGPTSLRIVLTSGSGFEGVVRRSGHPLSNVQLGVLNEAQQNIQVAGNITDTEGRYKIDRLPPGRYTLYAGVDDFSWSIRREAETADGTITVLDFDFEDTANSLEGRVSVDGAQPLSTSVQVEIAGNASLQRFRPETYQIGEYRLTNLPVGDVTVSVWAKCADGSTVKQSYTVPIIGGQLHRDFDLRTH